MLPASIRYQQTLNQTITEDIVIAKEDKTTTMLASRRDQENAIHAQQTAATAKATGAKPLMPKTPSQQPMKMPYREKRSSDENATSKRKLAGKVKDAVAVLEGQTVKPNVDLRTPAGTRIRAPLGIKTGNVKTNAFQTPAKALTQQKPTQIASSPRLRKAKFQVHEVKDDTVETEPREHEIEHMFPRETPLPEFPDDELWPHDRSYPQFEGTNFTDGWALEFMDVKDESDFNNRIKHFEAQQGKELLSGDKSSTQIRANTAPCAASSARAASALSGVASFASATSASAARSKCIKPVTRNQRHTVAKAASKTTLGYSKGRDISTMHEKASPIKDSTPLTSAERIGVLNAMWRCADDSNTDDDDDEGDFFAPMLDNLDLHDVRDLEVAVPDD